MYKKYLFAINNLITTVLKINDKDEVRRIALSDERLAKDRFTPRLATKFCKGEIYQFEFGRNYFPEMSFEHRGLVIGVKGKLLYVLPICSYNANEKAHKNAYHPIDNPDKKQDFYLLKSSEFDFIKHDSVLKLTDLRTISVNRKLYSHFAKMDILSTTYKEIESLVLQKYFYEFYYDSLILKSDYDKLKSDLEKITAEYTELKNRAE